MSVKVMKRVLLFPGLIAAVTISGISLGENDHQLSRRLMEKGEILPLQEVLGHIERERTGRVLEVELDSERGRHVYEIELLGEEGRVWEYKLDAATGEVLERELED